MACAWVEFYKAYNNFTKTRAILNENGVFVNTYRVILFENKKAIIAAKLAFYEDLYRVEIEETYMESAHYTPIMLNNKTYLTEEDAIKDAIRIFIKSFTERLNRFDKTCFRKEELDTFELFKKKYFSPTQLSLF